MAQLVRPQHDPGQLVGKLAIIHVSTIYPPGAVCDPELSFWYLDVPLPLYRNTYAELRINGHICGHDGDWSFSHFPAVAGARDDG